VSIRGVDSETIDAAASLLRRGGVVAFPTETVYGLGANALDALAVARIFEIKARPSFDPLIVHVSSDGMLHSVVEAVPEKAYDLIERFWPGPLTIVLPKADVIAGIVTAGLDTVAVRMPEHPVARAIIGEAGVPIAAPSANPFGYLSPTRAEHVRRMLDGRVDLIVDGGPTAHGVESTIVVLDPPTLLRYGAVPAEEIEEITGPLERNLLSDRAPLAPGSLAQHYAPQTPVRIVRDPGSVPYEERRRAGLLAFRRPVEGYAAVRVLSERGDLREAAAQLFGALHELEQLSLERIDAQLVPEARLGAAINDRLRRASVPREAQRVSNHEETR
jgi:L-threonylcarbamoyladenylate synthase